MKLIKGIWILILALSSGYVWGQHKYTVTVKMPDPVAPPVINAVTVTPENKNLLLWGKVENPNIQSYRIYRDNMTTDEDWELVGSIPYMGENEFLDKTSFSFFRSYRYRIAAVDNCGNEIFSTQSHKTIRLTLEEESEQTYILTWNHYEGFEVDHYNIYRSIDNELFQLFCTLPYDNTSVIDYANTISDVVYQVEAVAKSADTKRNETPVTTRSNLVSSRLVLNLTDSANAGNLIVFPNPMVHSAMVLFSYDGETPYTLTLINTDGQTVFSTTVYSGEYELQRGNLERGIYILKLEGVFVCQTKLLVY